MPDRVDAAIVGAGPYGLSVAAHLGARARTFGEPMETWRERMPPDMLLRSAWDETSFSARGGEGTIDGWAAATSEPRKEPIPLQTFLRYAEWFRRTFVGETDPGAVVAVEQRQGGGLFRVTTDEGTEVDAQAIVLAVGAVPFAFAPPPLGEAIGEDVTFATDLQDYAAYASRRVLVVGGGQGGLESAALAARAGADVEIVVRSRIHWFADREPHKPRSPLRQRLYRVAYPVVGYGPPPLNRLVLHPELFAALPDGLKRRLSARVLRAGGSPWLRPHLEGVRMTEGVAVEDLQRRDGVVRLALSDGSTREAEAVIVATGFRFALDRIPFLSSRIRSRIVLREGWPVLDRSFQSTAPGVFFVGFAAAQRFGPIVRFIPGTRFAAPRVHEAFR